MNLRELGRIPETFTRTLNGDRFLFLDTFEDDGENADRIIVLST